MNKTQTFEQFLTTQSIQVDAGVFFFNLLITAVLTSLLALIYCKYSKSISNRKYFALNFILLGTTTMLIIAIVKSSLALSLGLVGALSIVRFRAAIKEPEELTYLFLVIAIGLGMGAGQKTITILAFIVISIFLILSSKFRQKIVDRNLYMTISTQNSEKVDIEQVVNILNKYSSHINLQSFNETPDKTELAFLIEFPDHKTLNLSKSELQKLHDSLHISFIDYKGNYAD